ncbi:MAG: copper homeostasis protein CutC [Planctomycetaceae bacterium]
MNKNPGTGHPDDASTNEHKADNAGLDEHPAAILELCVGGIDDVLLAAEMGVDRIELNCGMTTGGLTPSAGLVAAARRIFSGPIVAMVRPREGGFAYSRDEFLLMLNDAERMAELGISEFAIGFLRSEGTIDFERCRKLRAILPKCQLVFHKAFDVTPDRAIALRQLMDCGFDRILTSGGATTALEGATALRQLNELAGSRITLVAGGGIRAENVAEVIQRSGCAQIHSAVREIADDPSMAVDCPLHYGVSGHGAGSYGQASRQKLAQLLRSLNRIE